MSFLFRLCLGFLLLTPVATRASVLEIPGTGSNLSGIGVISGWKCEATAITVVIDDGNPIPMLHGSERGDTSRACGDTPNGFLAIFNWALLDDGEHDAVAYDNGVEFDRSTFTVGTLGEPFVQDASAEVRVEDFPSPGETTLLVWNESTQHFEIVDGARANMRSMTDRPDDISGAQIHPMYVLPSDGADAHLDTDETIATSVAAIQHWLSSNVSQRLRLDTFQGSLDITFFRLALTDAQMAAMGLFVRDQIERELSQAGRLSSDKLYAVYYGGKSTAACGGAAWPPALPGVVAAMYLNGEPPGAPPCHTNPLGMSLTTMGYWEFSMLHELFHLLGAVSTGAPNHVLRGHVADDPTDLMYAGSQPWKPQVIDVGRNDYYGHNNPNLLDLEDSPYLSR